MERVKIILEWEEGTNAVYYKDQYGTEFYLAYLDKENVKALLHTVDTAEINKKLDFIISRVS